MAHDPDTGAAKTRTSWNGVAATCTTLTQNERTWVLTGSKVFVPFADAATHFLVSVTDPATPHPRWRSFQPDTGRDRDHGRCPGSSRRTTRSASTMSWSLRRLVRAGDRSFDDSLAVARVMTAAYQVGGMLEMLDMSVTHSNTRVQFGTPIGRFQSACRTISSAC